MAWTATNGSTTLGPYDNGKFTFPINTAATEVEWVVTYTDNEGCTGSTTYTVLSGDGNIVDNGYAQCGTHKGEDILVTLSEAISLEDAKKAIKFVSSNPSGINNMQIARKDTSRQTTNEFYIKFENWPVNENEDTDENVQDITVTLSIYGTNKDVIVKNRGAFKVVLAKENKQWDKTNTDGAVYFSAYTEYICNNDIKTIIDKNKLCYSVSGPFSIPSDPGIMKSIDKDLEYTMPIFFKSGECQAEPGKPCTGTATVYLCDDNTKNLKFNLIYSASTRIVHFINFFKPQDGQGGTLTPNVYLCVVDANGNIPTGTDISRVTGYGGGFEYNFGKGNTISASELLSMGINVPSDYSPKSGVNVGAFWSPPNQAITPTSSHGNYIFSLSTNGGNRQDIYLACNGKKYIDAAGKETHYQNLCDYS